ncbi:hypothetical protein TNCV_5127601 [Trichonephila clavipes]|nr:hypothetical protein TNCV_5127601 [Trichonephila clavipes]
MSLRRHRRQYEQLSEFERGRIIDMMKTGWSARQVAGHSDLTVRKCWEQRRRHLDSDQAQDTLDRLAVKKTITSYDTHA